MPDDKVSIPEYLTQFKSSDLKKVAKLDILPSLKLALNDSVVVKVISIPIPTLFADGQTYFTMKLEHNGVLKQFVAQANSFRFQLGVLAEKLGSVVGKTIVISKEKVKMKKYPNAELYSVSLFDSI